MILVKSDDGANLTLKLILMFSILGTSASTGVTCTIPPHQFLSSDITEKEKEKEEEERLPSNCIKAAH